MPNPDPQLSPGRLRPAGHWAAALWLFGALWIFGGALYFYIHLTWLLVQENQTAIHAFGERLRQLLTIG